MASPPMAHPPSSARSAVPWTADQAKSGGLPVVPPMRQWDVAGQRRSSTRCQPAAWRWLRQSVSASGRRYDSEHAVRPALLIGHLSPPARQARRSRRRTRGPGWN